MLTLDLGFLTSLAVITSCVIAILSAVIFPMARKMKKFSSGWDDFMRDWKGEEPEPGRDKAPGVMERLNDIDGEFKKNSGSTLKDAVARIESKLNESDARMERIEDRLRKGDERMGRMETKLNGKDS
ncbi:hypothetical protein UFOVP221_67 [uncultured Caudovirales phage]|uniref:Uncharacterized protein n=1 Tax=uncultured Caudovirales phage TaxID=2100421 RepID=A0A6J7WMV3_9CAUD|nr:hypothetical protein UFOVP221_67 [uncultured Caudovirales phage]